MSHFTAFNTRGNVANVRAFWEQKLARIAGTPASHYVETSHLLIKAGLAENIATLTAAGTVHFILLHRDLAATVKSYRKRRDFANRINTWLWFLDPEYPNNIVKPDAAMRGDVDGICLWYVCEMMTRAEYYRLLLAGDERVVFHDAALETLGDHRCVAALLDGLGLGRGARAIAIPRAVNRSPAHFTLTGDEAERIEAVIAKYPFDAAALARDFFEKGGRIG